MNELIISSDTMSLLEKTLLEDEHEKCAVLLAEEVEKTNGSFRLLVKKVLFPEETDYIDRSKYKAILSPAFIAASVKQARLANLSLIFAHSHCENSFHSPVFSKIDDAGEIELFDFLKLRHPQKHHYALLVSKGGVRARELATTRETTVISLGRNRSIRFEPNEEISIDSEVFDRQMRAFGAIGQAQIEKLHIGIVGLGGTGSLIAQMLVHLGAKTFTLLDPDVIEPSNLNRVANAKKHHIGQTKVSVAEEYIHSVAPLSKITTSLGDVTKNKVSKLLLDTDVIFGCTDSHGSRAVLQQIAYQYFLPLIDMGVKISVKDGAITHIYGRVQLLSPGLACLTCSELLDSAEVRRDMMTAFERKVDPYIENSREPAPAVMSLNSVVSSLAVTMFLSIVTDIPSEPRHLLYNAMSGTVRPALINAKQNCYICSSNGALGRGNSWSIFGRED